MSGMAGGEQLVKARVMGESPAQSGVRAGRSQQLPETPWGDAYASGEVKEPPYDLDALAALYETHATNKACVDAKATNIAGIGYRFGSVSGTEPSAENRALLERLFGDCNPEMTFTEVLRSVWTDVEALGNGYLEITRNSLRELDGFYHVPATTVRVRTDHSGFVQIRDGRTREFGTVRGPESEGWALGAGG